MRTLWLALAGAAALLAGDPLPVMNDASLNAAQRNDACFALRGNRSPEAMAAMAKALQDPRLRTCAAENLRAGGAVNALRTALEDENPEVRALAARALGTLQRSDMLPALAAAARDPNLLTASNALQALSAYPEPVAQAYLGELANGGGLVGEMALERLAQSGDALAIPIARRLTASHNLGDILAGMRVLGEMGDRSDLPMLTEIARKETQEVSSKARGFGLMPAISLSRAAQTAIAGIEARRN